MDTQTIEAPAAASAPAPAAAPDTSGGAPPAASASAPAAADPFEVDEGTLAALSPESRTAVEPLLKQWKEKASSTLQGERSSKAELEKQAKAFNQLTSNPQFQKWYRELNNPQRPAAPAQTAPKTAMVTPEEWVQAATDPAKFAELQNRNARAVLEEGFGKQVSELSRRQAETELAAEFQQAERKYKDMNVMDYDKEEVFLLEPLVHYWKDSGHRPNGTVDDAFQHLKRIEDYFDKKYSAKYNAQVQQKKAGVTEPPAAGAAGAGNVVYANSAEQALRENIKAAISGQNISVVVRKGQK